MGLRTLPEYKPGLAQTGISRIKSTKAGLLICYILSVLPRVNRQLKQWALLARQCPEPALRLQALASLEKKAFHCQGGAVFTVNGSCCNQDLLKLIIAYQTLCDYLDNLCDRAGETDGQAFRQLHQSLIDALDLTRAPSDYYRYFALKADGGYIKALVDCCRSQISLLPSYHMVQEDVLRLAGWYCELQVRKHLSWDVREKELRDWVEGLMPQFPGLLWNELAAATGSTLAVFALLKLAVRENLNRGLVDKTRQAYFPWICALHILLDYFIDQQEDRLGRDLNFTFYYGSELEMMERLTACVYEARRCAADLPDSVFDLTVVEGLLAMYLTDGKVERQGYKQQAGELIAACSGQTATVAALCRLVRRFL
ncbi:MAG: tetraprenyl-beta-curcumene synthase family protein [Syntrophomonas sp.]